MIGSSCRDYTAFPGFSEILLEDSYVLAIREEPGRFALECELVLCEGHPAYRPPVTGEQHCYALGTIDFNASQVTWRERRAVVSTDATGEADLGNIDRFCEKNGIYLVEGSFGRVEIASPAPPVVTLRQ